MLLCVAILYLATCFTFAARAQPFALQLNPTGDPVGGGPGYTGIWRTAEGLPGQGIYTEADADYVVTTEEELRALSSSYWDRDLDATVLGSNPAQSGDVVFVKGDAQRVLLLNNTLRIDFNSGVTVASDLGYRNADGSYRWGTTVRMTEPILGGNPGYQTRALFEMTSGWRLTGLILEGPSAWGGRSNANDTVGFQGEAMAVRVVHADYDELPEIDNVWAFAWPYMAFSLYKGPALLHHFRTGYTWRQGYGYGVYPGRDVADYDGIVTPQHIVAGHLHNSRHAIDSNGTTFNPTTFQTAGAVELRVESTAFSGVSRAPTLNVHSSSGPSGYPHGYGTHIAIRRRLAAVDPRTKFEATTNWAPPEGYVEVGEIWSQTDPLDMWRISGTEYGDLLPDPNAVRPDGTGLFNLDVATIRPHGEGIVVPVVAASLDRSEITAGQSVALSLNATDPDGHAIRYYEVVWGDGPDALASTERFAPDETPTHTYAEAGVYLIYVTAFNEHGVPGYQRLYVEVAPTELSTRKWTFHVAPELPAYLQRDHAQNDLSGYYEARVKINGVTVYTFDWGDPASRGWRSVEVDAEASLAGATDFTLTLETETIGNPSAVNGLERADWYVDNLRLWGDDGLDADGAAWDKMDPTFDDTRSGYGTEYDWGYQSTGTRIQDQDSRGDWGYVASSYHGSTTVGQVTTKSSHTRPYLHQPRNLAVARASGGSGATTTWDVAPAAVRDRVNVRFYRQSDGALLHEALGEEDDGSYTWSGAGAAPMLVRVWPVARRWDDHSADAVGHYAEASIGENCGSGYCQDLAMNEGWNLVSTYVEPEDPRMEAVLGDASGGILMVKNVGGDAHSYEYGVGGIEAWDPLEAYAVYAESAVTLTVRGNSALGVATPIQLEPGWNLVPFLGREPMAVPEALATIEEVLEVVEDAEGRVYDPASGVNTIGLLRPGQGYKINVSQGVVLTYPEGENVRVEASIHTSAPLPVSGRRASPSGGAR